MSQTPYDAVASEYYDDRHKTCRNFDAATKVAIAQAKIALPSDGLILDVGCGRGQLTNYLAINRERIVQLDTSLKMLTLEPREESLLRICHRAESLPFIDAQFSGVAAFLCDPYFGLNFISEVFRILDYGGLFIFTLPSFEWAEALRGKESYDTYLANFRLRNGTTVKLPSNVVSEDRIREMLQLAGFAKDLAIKSHSLPSSVTNVSQDVISPAESLKIKPHDLPIITVGFARKERLR